MIERGAWADIGPHKLWGGPETVIVVSSDLSHFHNDETARRRDAATADMIEVEPGRGSPPETLAATLRLQGCS